MRFVLLLFTEDDVYYDADIFSVDVDVDVVVVDDDDVDVDEDEDAGSEV